MHSLPVRVVTVPTVRCMAVAKFSEERLNALMLAWQMDILTDEGRAELKRLITLDECIKVRNTAFKGEPSTVVMPENLFWLIAHKN